MYKIQDTETGLYWNKRHWTKVGHVFGLKGHLKLSVRMRMRDMIAAHVYSITQDKTSYARVQKYSRDLLLKLMPNTWIIVAWDDEGRVELGPLKEYMSVQDSTE
jgi:hypothetical protein